MGKPTLEVTSAPPISTLPLFPEGATNWTHFAASSVADTGIAEPVVLIVIEWIVMALEYHGFVVVGGGNGRPSQTTHPSTPGASCPARLPIS